MKSTNNFGLLKPEPLVDNVNIEVINGNMDIIDTNLSNIAKFETAVGTATAIVLSDINLKAGMSKTFIVSTDNNGGATTINGKPLYKPGTTTTPKLIAGKAVTVWYDTGSGGRFFIKASAEGDVVAANVLAGKTFSNDNDTGIIGTMPDNGPVAADTINLTDQNQEYTIAAGRHSGLRKIKAVITNLASGVIKAGITVGGILGTYTSDATAADADVLNGKTYYRNGVKGVGSMPNKTAVGGGIDAPDILAAGTQIYFRVPLGYYDGGGNSYVKYADPDFSPGNILATRNIFGLQGSIPDRSGAHRAASNTDANTPGRLYMLPQAGYYDGVYSLYFDDPDFIATNIKSGVNIFGLVGSLAVNKKSASGTAMANLTNDYYYTNGGDMVSRNSIEVSGLTFLPSLILCFDAQRHFIVYIGSRSTALSGISYQSSASGSVFEFQIPGPGNSVGYVNATGFRLPTGGYGQSHSWFAFE